MVADINARIERRSHRTIISALWRAQWKFGRNRKALTDADGTEVTYGGLLRSSFAIGRVLTRSTQRGENVGVMLPTGAASIIAFMAVLAYGRIPAMLNFSSGIRNLRSACRAANVKTIVTAHKFIEIAGLHELAEQLDETAKLKYLEDMREELTTGDKIAAVVGPLLPFVVSRFANPSEPGVILFTSGTEGDPKGVVLTHANVIANIEQINEHVWLEPNDILFNPLPTFHCYGLTAGALWPILTGRALVLHPSPLQTKIIPQRISETQATILLATDTFLQQYARAGDEDSLKSLRLAVCGAERVRDETRAMVQKKFGLEVLEGYGVTEAAPVLAANQPGDIRSGTVGRMLPAIDYRLEPVEGLEDAGRLYVKGPNIMAGYLYADQPGEIQPPEGGWHDTGDIVSIDKEGYISIKGRLKRFAKIGGEMVSLAVVENCASAIWPDYLHAAITLPDARKGEQIILISACPEADRNELRAWMQSHGVSPLAIPKRVLHTDEIPVLGTGKTDYVSVHETATSKLEDDVLSPVEPASTTENAPKSTTEQPSAT